jgi:iron complex outermembrane receptor protein
MRKLLLLLFLPACINAGAQSEADTLGKQDAGAEALLQSMRYRLSEVRITAYHNPERFLTAAGAVSVLPAYSLHLASCNIVPSLSGSPGVIIQEATPGTMKLTLRGIGTRYPYGTKKIKMFFDGIPLYSAEGETYFDDIGPEYLRRIEILRGPSSSIYGASLGGTLVLYPERAELGKTEIGLMGSAGSFGFLKNTISLKTDKGNDNLVLAYSGIKSEGYRENSSYSRNSILASYNHRFGSKVSGTLLLSASSVTAYIPSSLDSATYVSDPRAAAPAWLETRGNKTPKRILSGYKLNFHPSGRWEVIGSLFGTCRKNEENRPFNFLDESDLSYGGRILARYALKKESLDFRVTTGTNLFLENYGNSIYENIGGTGRKGELQQKGRESVYQADLFSQFDLFLSDFTFTGGFNLNSSGFRFTDLFSNDTIDQTGTSLFDPVFSPRLSVSWSPNKQVSAYIAVNHGFTIPSVSETMTPLGLINNDIKPEKAWSYETGTRLNLFRERTFIDLALYYMRVSDLIVPKRVEEDFYVGMNAGASLHKGIEISFRQWLMGDPGNIGNSPLSLLLDVSYSLNSYRFLEFTEEQNDYSGNRLPGVPSGFFSGSIDIRALHGLYSRIEVLSSGKIPLDDLNSRYSDPWTVVNARTGYSLKLGKRWGADLMVMLYNITNEKYVSMVVVNAPGTPSGPPRYYYPGMPFNVTFSAGLRYRFSSG